MNKGLISGLLFAIVVALVLRLPHVAERPMHNDEAVNGIKFGALWLHGDYKYDPNEHHGPTLYYATLLATGSAGSKDLADLTERRLRFLTVLFCLGLIPLVFLLKDGLGPTACVWAALFTAVSPSFVFYSRYYIHEMLLVFFTLLALVSGWRYWQSRKIR